MLNLPPIKSNNKSHRLRKYLTQNEVDLFMMVSKTRAT